MNTDMNIFLFLLNVHMFVNLMYIYKKMEINYADKNNLI